MKGRSFLRRAIPAALTAAATATAIATAAPPASANTTWHRGTGVWAGVCDARADLATSGHYATAWRLTLGACTGSTLIDIVLRVDGRTTYNLIAPSYSQAGRPFGMHVYRFRRTTRLDVYFLDHGDADSHVQVRVGR